MSKVTLCRKCLNELKSALEDGRLPNDNIQICIHSSWKKLWSHLFYSLAALWKIYVFLCIVVMTTTLLMIQYVPDGLRQIVIKY